MYMSILESPDPFLSQIFFFTQIQELLGDGAFGRVLKARDLQEDTDLGTRSLAIPSGKLLHSYGKSPCY